MSASQPPAVGSPRVALFDRASIHTFRWAWGVLALFTVVQLIRVVQSINSLSTDEALAVLAGRRTLDGFGIADRYLTFLPGSLLWPAVTGVAYEIAGSSGVRMLALACTLIAIAAMMLATRILFGDRAAVLAGIAMAVSAPYLVIAHLAFMETLAVMAVAVAFLAIALLATQRHRQWVAVAAGAMMIAVLAQYRAGLLMIPLTLVILVLRGREGKVDAALFWLMASLPFIIYFQAFSTQLVGAFETLNPLTPSQSTSAFASEPARRLLLALWGGLPLAIALAGWWRVRGQRRLTAALIVGPAIWLVLLLAVADLERSLVFPDLALGMLLLYPVIGLALSQARLSGAEYGALAILAGLVAVIGAVHTDAFDRSWADSSRTSDYLESRVVLGDRLLASDRWPLALSLYNAGLIAGPDDVLDEAALFAMDDIVDLCTFEWFAGENTIAPWSPYVESAIRSCGSFEPVQIVPTDVSGISERLRAMERTIRLTVLRNTNPYSELTP